MYIIEEHHNDTEKHICSRCGSIIGISDDDYYTKLVRQVKSGTHIVRKAWFSCPVCQGEIPIDINRVAEFGYEIETP